MPLTDWCSMCDCWTDHTAERHLAENDAKPEGTTKVDRVKCSLCAALVERADGPLHARWHDEQPRRPHCRQHTLFQPSCPTCVASRA